MSPSFDVTAKFKEEKVQIREESIPEEEPFDDVDVDDDDYNPYQDSGDEEEEEENIKR